MMKTTHNCDTKMTDWRVLLKSFVICNSATSFKMQVWFL